MVKRILNCQLVVRLAYFFALLGFSLHGLRAEEGVRPNVLFIAVDDLACTLGCYGDVVAKTPNIDRLASEGVCFTRAYNQLPLCNPTRASLMTGLRPDRIGVYDLDRHFRDEVPDAVTLPQVFQQAGYCAARVGKIYHYNVPASIGTDGFDDRPSWNLTINPKGRDKREESLVVNAEPHRKISAALSWLAADGKAEEQTDGMIATAAIELLKQERSQPLFLAVGFFRPHTPYIAPKRFFELYPQASLRLPFAPQNDREDIPVASFAHNCPVPNYGLDEATLLRATQGYYACVSMVDEQVGRILAAVEALGQADNTVVVFWSDHGYHLGEHGGVWQKRTLFENSARSPLIIKPARKRQVQNIGRASGPCRRVVEFVDIYPTVCELAGIDLAMQTGAIEKHAAAMDGKSLVPLIANPSQKWDSVAVTQVVRPSDSRLPEAVMGRSIRNERYRYTQWNGGEHGEELYDYHADPGEFRNLAIDPDSTARDVIHAMKAAMSGKAFSHIPNTAVINPLRL